MITGTDLNPRAKLSRNTLNNNDRPTKQNIIRPISCHRNWVMQVRTRVQQDHNVKITSISKMTVNYSVLFCLQKLEIHKKNGIVLASKRHISRQF